MATIHPINDLLLDTGIDECSEENWPTKTRTTDGLVGIGEFPFYITL